MKDPGADEQDFFRIGSTGNPFSGAAVGPGHGHGNLLGIVIVHGVGFVVLFRVKKLEMPVDGIGNEFITVYDFVSCHGASSFLPLG